jgi:hypothetical protein
MVRKRWDELDPRLRQVMLVAASVEAGLKIAALIDLAQHPAPDIRGSKRLWAAGLTFVNSAGILPIVYLLRGRRTV